MNGPEIALAVCRCAHGAATALLWGAFASLAFLVPESLRVEVAGRLAAFRSSAIVIALISTAARLPIEAASIGAGWAALLDGSTVRSVLCDTAVGRAWQAEAAASLVLAATSGVPAELQPVATAAASALVLLALPLSGHAAMHEGALGVAHRVDDAVHALAGGAWLGGLVSFRSILSRLGDRTRPPEAMIALRRLSVVGHGAVVLVVGTGAVNTGLVLGRWPTDWSSPYQALLAVKILLVAAMTVLALINRYVFVPRLASSRSQALRFIAMASVAEIGLGLSAIACSSLFGLMDPA